MIIFLRLCHTTQTKQRMKMNIYLLERLTFTKRTVYFKHLIFFLLLRPRKRGRIIIVLIQKS
jgi:hypothetical protein